MFNICGTLFGIVSISTVSERKRKSVNGSGKKKKKKKNNGIEKVSIYTL